MNYAVIIDIILCSLVILAAILNIYHVAKLKKNRVRLAENSVVIINQIVLMIGLVVINSGYANDSSNTIKDIGAYTLGWNLTDTASLIVSLIQLSVNLTNAEILQIFGGAMDSKHVTPARITWMKRIIYSLFVILCIPHALINLLWGIGWENSFATSSTLALFSLWGFLTIASDNIQALYIFFLINRGSNGSASHTNEYRRVRAALGFILVMDWAGAIVFLLGYISNSDLFILASFSFPVPISGLHRILISRVYVMFLNLMIKKTELLNQDNNLSTSMAGSSTEKNQWSSGPKQIAKMEK